MIVSLYSDVNKQRAVNQHAIGAIAILKMNMGCVDNPDYTCMVVSEFSCLRPYLRRMRIVTENTSIQHLKSLKYSRIAT